MELIERTAQYRYQSLQKYLDVRYANTVVLFFREIEDILGFALPGAAWLRQEWWSNPTPEAATSEQSLSWTNSKRTAAVNLAARKVTFTRVFP
jgi:hypothetical protein